jgi:hypothetical protein
MAPCRARSRSALVCLCSCGSEQKAAQTNVGADIPVLVPPSYSGKRRGEEKVHSEWRARGHGMQCAVRCPAACSRKDDLATTVYM